MSERAGLGDQAGRGKPTRRLVACGALKGLGTAENPANRFERLRYEVDPDKAGAFASAVCRYLPEIRAEHLAPDFAGVRPKLQGPDEPFRDFVIAEESSRGLPGLIDLIGIESPGLTAAGEIAERVADLV